LLSSGFLSAESFAMLCWASRSFRSASVRSMSMYLSPGGFQPREGHWRRLSGNDVRSTFATARPLSAILS
jgi:hypothetical protein